MSEKITAITFGANEPTAEDARTKALQLISAFKRDKSVSDESAHYSGVTKIKVAKDLEDAISNSSKNTSIKQGNSSLCGPAAFFFPILAKRPDIYTQVVLSLYKQGEAKLEKLKLKSSTVARKISTPSIKRIDWMIMSSIKPGYDNPEHQASGITWPRNLVKWLEDTGHQVVDKTPPSSTGLDSLLEAQRAYAGGYTVFLLVHSDLFKASGKSNPSLFPPNHWAVLNSTIKIKKYDPVSKKHKAPAVLSSVLVRDILEEWGDYEEALEEFNDIDGERFEPPVKINNQILLDVFTWGKRHMPVFNELSTSRKPEIRNFLRGYYGYIKARR
ncbi:MAG TPA: hypothetical protein ENJ08_15325 [Gammaproteobacteria bacterium]|nr:hypothetical protein [Gammaproteobacteria bacterium]